MNPMPPPCHPSTARRIWLAALVVFWIGCVAVSLLICGDGFLHPETYSFLPHYLSDRPPLLLIFDNQITDWNNYQARELSFLFDWLDAHFIAASCHRGLVHFFSASHYLLLLVAGLSLWQIATRHLALPRLAAFALVAMLWTCPTAMLYGSFYRSAKVALACMALLTIWAWFAARDGQARFARSRTLLFALAAVAMPLCDKLGLLFLCGLSVLLVHQAAVRRTPADRRLLVAGLGALLLAWSYQSWIGPAIVRHLLGYQVNADHLALSAGKLADPRFLATVFGGAAIFTLDSFRVPLGRLPAGVALLAAAFMCREFARFGPPARPRWLGGGWLFAGLALFITATFAAMLFVFPQMFSNEHRRFYYPMPAASLWLVAAGLALASHLRRHPQNSRLVELLLLALVMGNFFDLQADRFLLHHGKYQPCVENATRVRNALLGRDPAAAGITPAMAAALLPKAPYFRDAVPPSLDLDRIFLCLRSQSK